MTNAERRVQRHICLAGLLVIAFGLGMLCAPPEKQTVRAPTTEEMANTLAMMMDGEELISQYKTSSIPIPKRKPEQGYTLAFREDMNDFIEGFIE